VDFIAQFVRAGKTNRTSRFFGRKVEHFWHAADVSIYSCSSKREASISIRTRWSVDPIADLPDVRLIMGYRWPAMIIQIFGLSNAFIAAPFTVGFPDQLVSTDIAILDGGCRYISHSRQSCRFRAWRRRKIQAYTSKRDMHLLTPTMTAIGCEILFTAVWTSSKQLLLSTCGIGLLGLYYGLTPEDHRPREI